MIRVAVTVVVLMALLVMPALLRAEPDAAAGVESASIVNLELKNVPVSEGIESLFQGRGLRYQIEPVVTGRIVELKLKGVTFAQALDALVDAADLSYVIRDGTYIISPGKPKSAGAGSASEGLPYVRTPEGKQPAPRPVEGLTPLDKPVPSAAPTAQVQINNQQSPVFYGQPGGAAPGYYAPPYYRAGNVGFLYGWPPVVISSGTPYVLNFGVPYPPPPGWVSPDELRFLRRVYSFQARPYFTGPLY